MKRHVLIALGCGLALGTALFLGRGGLRQESAAGVWLLLCDAAFIPGILLIGLGALAFAADDGVFDIFGFTLQRFTSVFRGREKRDAMPRTFYEYRQWKHGGKKADTRFLLAAGAVLLALAGVLLILYNASA